MNLNPDTMKIEDNPLEFESLFSTVVHEVGHILAFSSWLLKYYVDPVTRKLLGEENVVKKVNIRGHDTNIIITPNVVREVRNHFGC